MTTVYGAWPNIPLKDLVLFIDGLDEVPTDKFTETLKYINEFSERYCCVSVVLSCRKLFYNFYDAKSILSTFEVHELDSFTSQGIDDYLNRRLGKLFHEFKEAIYKNSVLSLLYQPFYLVNLANDFLRPPHKLPGSKLKVLESFMERSLSASLDRLLKDSDKIKMQSVNFKKTVERFAFALQLAGVNAFHHNEVQELFSREEQILLQHNSMVAIIDDKEFYQCDFSGTFSSFSALKT